MNAHMQENHIALGQKNGFIHFSHLANVLLKISLNLIDNLICAL